MTQFLGMIYFLQTILQWRVYRKFYFALKAMFLKRNYSLRILVTDKIKEGAGAIKRQDS